MTKTEEIVTKLSKDFHILKRGVEGNGTPKGSLSGRIDDLEKCYELTNDRLLVVENYPCKDGCLFKENEEENEEMKNRKRSFRIADIANYIQLAALSLIIYGMFIL